MRSRIEQTPVGRIASVPPVRVPSSHAKRTVLGKEVVAVHGLCFTVSGREILVDVDLTVAAGTSVAITGPSGSGKTTLLTCLAGLTRPQRGTVQIAGTELTRLRRSRLPEMRLRNIGFVYQFGELLPELTPVENIALPAQFMGRSRRDAYDAASALLRDLGIAAVAQTPTQRLSGGERQRVAVARALVTSPSVILADEPTGALDEQSVESVADVLFSLPASKGCALVVVTHNELVARRADFQYVLRSGGLEPLS